MNRLVAAAAVIVFLGTTTALLGQGTGWSIVNSKIRREFPQVSRISTNELAAWLTDPKREKPVLLDVRTQAEFDLSHLEGAHRVEPGSAPETSSIPRDQPVVTYCSVGYRSAKFAEKLHEAGYQNVVNLEGSIFRWANENRPLVHNNQPTDMVHPCNYIWGLLLDKSHRAN